MGLAKLGKLVTCLTEHLHESVDKPCLPQGAYTRDSAKETIATQKMLGGTHLSHITSGCIHVSPAADIANAGSMIQQHKV